MDIDDIIRQHGLALQSVLTNHPHDPPYCYTIGRHLHGQPELIVFGGHPDQAGPLLNELALDHPAHAIRAGARRPVAQLHGERVELRAARPEWVARHGLFAFDHAQAAPEQVPFLQVVLPDHDGRLPGEHGRPVACACCPDLSHAPRPWVLPVDTASLHGLVLDFQPRPADARDVCLPVRSDGEDRHRVERVLARDRGDGTVQLLQPPVLADWTTAGAVHRLDVEPDSCGDPVADDVVRASPRVHLAWSWSVPLPDRDDSDMARIDEALRRITGLPDVAVTMDQWWLAIAAPSSSSHRVRATMRRLTRDGLAHEADLFSRPSRVCTNSRCARCKRPFAH